jgi:hypothetical protein
MGSVPDARPTDAAFVALGAARAAARSKLAKPARAVSFTSARSILPCVHLQG